MFKLKKLNALFQSNQSRGEANISIVCCTQGNGGTFGPRRGTKERSVIPAAVSNGAISASNKPFPNI